jgi:hypothetical protein
VITDQKLVISSTIVLKKKREILARGRANVGGRARGPSKASSSRGYSKKNARPKKVTMKRSAKNKLANGRPKKALAPYMFFCKDQRENITGDNPNISFGDVGRILGSQWQSMSEKDRMVCMKTPFCIYFPILHEITITHQNDHLHTHLSFQTPKVNQHENCISLKDNVFNPKLYCTSQYTIFSIYDLNAYMF